MRHVAIVALSLIVLLLASGCTLPKIKPVAKCGNGECGADETLESCPKDCAECIDTDGGVDYYGAGETYNRDPATGDIFTIDPFTGLRVDEPIKDDCSQICTPLGCTGEALTEGLCWNNVAYSFEYECPEGCNADGTACAGEGERAHGCVYHDEGSGEIHFLKLGKRACNPYDEAGKELVVCAMGSSGPEFRHVHDCQGYCDVDKCSGGAGICFACGSTATKYCPEDTGCSTDWPTDEGEFVKYVNDMPSCGLFEVCSAQLDPIIQSAKDCCTYASEPGGACGVARSATEERGRSVKYCMGVYLIKSLGNYAAYMRGYFYSELCCAGKPGCGNKGTPGSCTPKNYNEYANALPCPGASDSIWASDEDMSENTCWFYTLPAHVSISIIQTGTCADYSVAVTTLLRKAGYGAYDAMSIAGCKCPTCPAESQNCHAYNLVRLDGDSKWHFVDTTNNAPGIRFEETPPENPLFQWDYCAYTMPEKAANDKGYVEAPPKNKIYGCGPFSSW